MVSYRLNTMKISSIDNFADIRGGFNNELRDVYFVRLLGASNGINTIISEIDRKMGSEMQAGRVDYFRVSKLPAISNSDDIATYSGIYDAFYSGRENFRLKNVTISNQLKEVIFAAMEKVIKTYKSIRNNANESIIKNFAVKILYWLDYVAVDALSNWDERRSIKIIAENITKEQEYLFFYFLSNIGCDVLLLQLEADVQTADSVKALSYVISEDVFSRVIIPDYVKYVPENNKLTVVIPERNRKSRSSDCNVNIKSGTVNRNVRAEKSYEELAQLASSIVMIAVHDRNGEVDGTGSGIMISEGGYILTNFHVVTGGSFFSVRMEDDEEIYRTYEIVKYHTNLDLAIIRIDKKLKPLPIYKGQEKLVRGQKVVAIGSPLGLFNSVSDGIVSGFRKINGEEMIQFTAPISHGSSGGAVLNMYGEVIGISTAGIEAGQNINLAMGYECINPFVNGFIDK